MLAAYRPAGLSALDAYSARVAGLTQTMPPNPVGSPPDRLAGPGRLMPREAGESYSDVILRLAKG
jgi:hypothetical protein